MSLKDKIITLYEQGRSSEDIVLKLECELSEVNEAIQTYLEDRLCRLEQKRPSPSSLHKKHIQERRDQVRNLYQKGYVVSEMARETNSSYNTVYNDLKALGLKVDDSLKAVIQTRLAHVRKLHAQGLSALEIAHKLESGETTIRKDLQRLKLKANNPQQSAIQNRRKIVRELYTTGHLGQDIAIKLKCHIQTI